MMIQRILRNGDSAEARMLVAFTKLLASCRLVMRTGWPGRAA